MVVESKSDSLCLFWCRQFSELENTQKALSTPVAFTWTELIECVYLVYERERDVTTSLRLDRQNTYFMWGYIAHFYSQLDDVCDDKH